MVVVVPVIRVDPAKLVWHNVAGSALSGSHHSGQCRMETAAGREFLGWTAPLWIAIQARIASECDLCRNPLARVSCSYSRCSAQVRPTGNGLARSPGRATRWPSCFNTETGALFSAVLYGPSTRFRRMSHRLFSTILAWTAIIAMPFQFGWSADCGCLTEAASACPSKPTVGSCCCGGQAASVPACCQKPVAQQPGCPCGGMNPNAERGCKCGPNCQCGAGRRKPSQPAAPAPDSTRDSTSGPLIASTASVVYAADENGMGSLPATSSELVFSGMEICVLLCRLTL
jgi:hypothetical protein